METCDFEIECSDNSVTEIKIIVEHKECDDRRFIYRKTKSKWAKLNKIGTLRINTIYGGKSIDVAVYLITSNKTCHKYNFDYLRGSKKNTISIYKGKYASSVYINNAMTDGRYDLSVYSPWILIPGQFSVRRALDEFQKDIDDHKYRF